MGQSQSTSKAGAKSNNMGQLPSIFKVGAQWEWQSNADPWGSEKPQWKPYTPLDNHLLEKAYFNKQEEVDLGDYIVSIKHLLQKKKNDKFRRRKVRRNEEAFKQMKMEELKKNEQENSRTKRFFGAETPKTYNKTFGSLKDFVLFFTNRGPEIKSFATKFQETEDSQDVGRLNQEILPLLIAAIKKESASKKEKEVEEIKIINLFQIIFQSFKEFYANILKAYTEDGFLYKNLNRYLRNEDWTLLDCLLPYAFCLFKAFLWSEFTSAAASNNPQISQDDDDDGQKSKMTVYRGAQLDEISLSFYNPQTVSTFSWNAVTSTSRNRNVAENFMKSNRARKKIPVMFVIDVPISPDDLNSSTWIDIKPFSAFPTEDEIVLSPGSTFKLMNIVRDKKAAEIQLELVTEVSTLAHQGHIMHGAMHTEMTMSSVSRVVGLEGNELGEALYHLKGNGLIEKLELALCKFDSSTLAILIETLPTIPRLAKLSCVSISSKDKTDKTYWNAILKSLRKENIEGLEIHNQPVIDEESLISLAQGVKYLTSLTTLNLSFDRCEQITDKELHNLCSQGIRYLTSLTALNLSFEWCSKITDKGLSNLCSQGIRYLTSLTALNLSFEWCWLITDEGVNNLSSQGIRYLTSLTALNLSFAGCYKITDEGVNNLCFQGIRYLTALTALNLSFDGCEQITDEGLNNLCSQGIKYLTSLTTLNLSFAGCDQITDEGLKSLKHQVNVFQVSFVLNEQNSDYFGKKEYQWKREIKNESSNDIKSNFGINFLNPPGVITLNSRDTVENFYSLSTKVGQLNNITCLNLAVSLFRNEKELIAFGSEKLRYLDSLTALNLSFKGCSEITDEGVNNLCSQGIRYLTSLTSLNLSFEWCKQITDEGVNNLSSQGIRYLTSLTALSLSFYRCSKITDEGLNNLSSQGIRYLTSLTALNLSFAGCEQITDKGLHNLCSQGIRYLTSLTALNLSFLVCSYITDEGVNNLFSQGIRYLTSLTALNLNFTWCSKITDEGVNNLCSQGIRYLTSLTALDLSFAGCEQITDKGLHNLCSQGIRYLTSLTALSLSFLVCSEITDEGVNNLCSEGIRYLTSLTALNLSFAGCEQITDEGLNNLSSQGIRYLTSLTALNLSFESCKKITDEGVNNLCSHGIRYLTSLTALNLNFTWCSKIIDEGLNNLCSQGIRYLTSLTALNLSFAGCEQITDEGLNNLCSQGIRYLTSLTTLYLNFSGCSGISNAGTRNSAFLLKYFGYQPQNLQ